jgi:transcription antitermination factor NusG
MRGFFCPAAFSERRPVNLHTAPLRGPQHACFNAALPRSNGERNWHAVFTLPQNEKSVARHLEIREVESFLPTYETIHVWNNRQRKKVILPLFPSYLFVHIAAVERARVLESPGVLTIVGQGRELCPIPDAEIEFLRSGLCRQRVEPFRELVIGQRVRIRSGIMCGVEGTLVRKGDSLRFVLTLNLINQNAAVEVDAAALEPICA